MSTMASSIEKEEEKVDAGIWQPSEPHTAPKTLNEMTMERVMAEAQKIYAQDPSQDFTKDAIDTATRENAPAKDAAEADSLQMQRSGDLLLADTKSESTPPTTPSTEK